MNTTADFRATCRRCGFRFCWSGTLFDMPPCPGCGQCMSAEEMYRGQQQLECDARQNRLNRLTTRHFEA